MKTAPPLSPTEAYARAIQSTTDAYQRGLMSHTTWLKHLTSLWGTVTHLGLRAEVVQLVDEVAQRPMWRVR
jgi:hypothetical protein